MRVIYLDVLLVLNFCMDYCILRAAAGLSGRQASHWRMVAGAGLGAGYAALSVFVPTVAAVPIRLLWGGVITQTAFGARSVRSWVRMYLMVLLAAFVCGGCVLALGAMTGTDFYQGGALYAPVSRRVLFSAAVLAHGLSCVVFRRQAQERGETVKITVCGQEHAVFLLCDTGNTLSDPMTGKPVVLLSRRAALDLLPQELHSIVLRLTRHNAAELLSAQNTAGISFRLLPFDSIGGDGMLLCFRPERMVRQDGTVYDAVAAIACTEICSGDYDGLIATG